MAEYIRSITVTVEIDTNKRTIVKHNAELNSREQALSVVEEAFDAI